MTSEKPNDQTEKPKNQMLTTTKIDAQQPKSMRLDHDGGDDGPQWP
jgi:hypothetical protein